MAIGGKSLCRLSKEEIKTHEEMIVKEIKKPKYYCKKCVRVAKNREQLCKPEKMKS